MRPVSLRFRCFGPYMQEQFVDFEALQKSGLFLICGETGAGKTTILDAICYALYGKSSGGLRGDLSVMRCKLAGQGDETLTEFVFDCNGKRYKFIRSLKYGRKNLNDSHNCLVREGEEFVPIFENPKATFVNQKAVELIGLTYEQFRQVILLPQGQFEKLLVSDSVEKEKILVSLFRADRWQRMAEELYRRVAEQDAALKQEKLEITGKLREYDVDSTVQLAEKAAAQEITVETLTREREAARQQVLLCRQEQEQAVLANSAYEELARWENQLAQLESRKPQFAGEEALLKKADRAEQLRPKYLAWQNASRNRLRVENQWVMASENLNRARQAFAEAEAQRQRHEQQRPAYEQARQQLLRLEDARELYDTLEVKKQRSAKAEQAWLSAKAAHKNAEVEFTRRDRRWQQAVLRQNQAIRGYQQLQEGYLRGIGSTLAAKLTEGEPCPVCGNREHPAPAPASEQQVSDAMLEQSKQDMNRAVNEESAFRADRQAGEAELARMADHLRQAAQEETVYRTEYESALTRRVPGIEDSGQLEKELNVLRRKLQTYERQETDLQKGLTEAGNALAAAESRLRDVQEELTAAQALSASENSMWLEALAESGLTSEKEYLAADMDPKQRQQRLAALSRFRADYASAEEAAKQQRQALEGKTAPDMKAVKAAQAQADKIFNQLSSQCVLAENLLKNMKKDLHALEKRQAEYQLRRQKTDSDLDFANRLRGRSGVSLQRYVLGVMLTSVTSAANELLRGVCGGRYRLYRTDEIAGSGRKGGLELEVYDSRTNARRSVTTLSGGEKFLVALSLAIGLSTVVQAQGSGIRLEAMFIDEGFGSLDREAVNDALEVLQGIQRSSGVVGIISHVESLTESIPARLEVTREKDGSRCRLCI